MANKSTLLPKSFVGDWTDASVQCSASDVVFETSIMRDGIGTEAAETKIVGTRLLDSNRAEVDTQEYTEPYERGIRLLTLSRNATRLTMRVVAVDGKRVSDGQASVLKRCPNAQ